jgi:ferritin
VAEQVEEESSAQEVIDKLKLVADGGMLFQLDKDLGTRVFVPPAASGE